MTKRIPFIGFTAAAMLLGYFDGPRSAARTTNPDANREQVIELSKQATSVRKANPDECVRLAEQAASVSGVESVRAIAENALGNCYEAKRDLEAAFTHYAKAHELDPKWKLPLYGMGDARLATDTISAIRQAIQHYEEGLKLPNRPTDTAGRDDAMRARVSELQSELRARTVQAMLAMSRGDPSRDLEEVSWEESAPGGNRNEKPATVATPTPATKPVTPPVIGSVSVKPARTCQQVLSLLVPFEWKDATLKSTNLQEFDGIAAALGDNRWSGKAVQVIGHASPEGDAAFNLDLSRRRALAVNEYLVTKKGVPSSLLVTDWKGVSDPIHRPDGSVDYEASRRVVVSLKEPVPVACK